MRFSEQTISGRCIRYKENFAEQQLQPAMKTIIGLEAAVNCLAMLQKD